MPGMRRFLRFAALLWTEATAGAEAVNAARRGEREAIVRWLRTDARPPGDVHARAALERAANMIAGGAHYR